MTSTTEDEVLDFASGIGGADEFDQEQKAARAAARGRPDYFKLADAGDFEILRFLFEAEVDPADPANTGFIYVQQHPFVLTKDAPADKPGDRTWPKKIPAICRRTPVGPNRTPAFPDCYIDDNCVDENGRKERARLYLWASAVLREQVVGTQELVDQGRIAPSQIGQKVIIDKADLVDEVDANGNLTGRKVWKKRYVYVNMEHRNFFSRLVGLARDKGTILDRDYKIERRGKKGERGVEYNPIPMDPFQVTVMRDGQPVVVTYDLREPEIAALYADGPKKADLAKIVNTRISKAWYDRYFDIRHQTKFAEFVGGDEDDSKGDAQAQGPDAPPPPPTAQQQAGNSTVAEPTEGVDADKLNAMRARLLGNGGAQAAPAAAEAPAAAPAAPAAAPTPPAFAPAAPAAPPIVG